MMEGRKLRQKTAVLMALVLAMTAFSPQAGVIANLPDALVMYVGDETCVEVSTTLSAELAERDSPVIEALDRKDGDSVSLKAGQEAGTAEVVFRLLGLVPVKTMTVTVAPSKLLIPGGRSLGVAIETPGVMVVGASDLGNTVSPAHRAGIRAGDLIERVDGTEIHSAEELSQCVKGSDPVQVSLLRDGKSVECRVAPEADPRDGVYRLGVWVRENTAGVGTLTYYDPADSGFGALGHAITDMDTGAVFPVGEGAVYDNTVVQIVRGEEGNPGELTGAFFEEQRQLGEIERNTDSGIFGTGNPEMISDSLYPEGLPIAARQDVHTGDAQILSTIEGKNIQAYDCCIEKLYTQNAESTRCMMLRITDPTLLEQTGGIVQGMSGSPIIQDGKLIGAVTHVLVNDPTRGYGIFIENMLDAAG